MVAYTLLGSVEAPVRAYAALMRLYPPNHRREYGPLMVQLFRDQVRDARRHGGPRGLVLLYIRTLADVVVSLLREHGRAVGIVDPLGGWSYGRAPWWQALLAAVPGLLLILSDLRLFRLAFPLAPYPPPTAMAMLPVAGSLAIVGYALLRERGLPDWAFTSAGVLISYIPYAVALLWGEGAGALWSALGLPAIALVIGSIAGLATVFRHRIGSGELPRWAWIVAGLSLLAVGATAVHEAAANPPWRWETVLMVVWRWGFSTLLLTAPLLCAVTVAPARGARAVLLVLPIVLWWSVGTVLEPSYGLANVTWDRAALLAIDLLPRFVLLVLVPLALLRVRLAAYQALTLLLASMGTLLVVELLRAGVRPELYAEGALFAYRSGFALQLSLALGFVIALYDSLARATQMDWVV